MQNPLGKKIYSKLLVILVILAILLIYVFALPPTASGKENDTLPVYNAILLQNGDFPVQNKYVGYVAAINSVYIVPYVTGYVDKILVGGGDYVEAGQTLILIRQDEYKAKLNAAKAQVLQAEADYNNASLYYQRIKKAGTKAVSQTELDNAKAKYLSSQAALAQAKANRDLAQVNYDYTFIKAPQSGIIGDVYTSVGAYISPASDPFMRIIQTSPIRVIFSISDKEYLEEIAKGDKELFSGDTIKVRLSDGRLYNKEGKFSFTENTINKKTNSVTIFTDFENPQGLLVTNAYVDVLIDKTYKNGVLIPQTSVYMQPDGNFIYAAVNSQLKKLSVEIVKTIGGNYLVKNTFAPNTYLITDKITDFIDGKKIKIKQQNYQNKTAEKK